jgi:hypothetical protein
VSPSSALNQEADRHRRSHCARYFPRHGRGSARRTSVRRRPPYGTRRFPHTGRRQGGEGWQCMGVAKSRSWARRDWLITIRVSHMPEDPTHQAELENSLRQGLAENGIDSLDALVKRVATSQLNRLRNQDMGPLNAIPAVFVEGVHERPCCLNCSKVLPLMGRSLSPHGRKGYQGRSPWLVINQSIVKCQLRVVSSYFFPGLNARLALPAASPRLCTY